MNATPSHADVEDHRLPPLLVVLSLASALALWPLFDGMAHKAAYLLSAALRTSWFVLATVPLANAAVLLRSPRDRGAWLGVLALALVPAVLGWRAGSQCTAEGPIRCDTVLVPFALALAAVWFIAAAFLAAWLAEGTRRMPAYARLHQAAWSQLQVLASVVILLVLGWLALWLWQSLFALVGVKLFERIFREAAFAWPASGLLVGIGLVYGRALRGGAVDVQRAAGLLGRGLVPLLAALAPAFLATLPFTGLAPLWSTRHAASLLLILVAALVLLANVLFEDGRGNAPAWQRHLLQAALLTLPVYAALAAWAIVLRVAQYGWTPERLWAALLASFALLYALGYAVASARWRANPWLAGIAPVNIGMAMIVASALTLTQTPLLDFMRIATHDQIARAESGRMPWNRLDVRALAAMGRVGHEAMRGVRPRAEVVGNPQLVADIDKALSGSWIPVRREAERDKPDPGSADFARIKVAGGQDTVPRELLEALVGHADWSDCGRTPQDCRFLHLALLPEPAQQWLLIRRTLPNRVGFFIERAEGWVARPPVWVNLSGKENLLDLIDAGRFHVVVPTQGELIVGDDPVESRETPLANSP